MPHIVCNGLGEINCLKAAIVIELARKQAFQVGYCKNEGLRLLFVCCVNNQQVRYCHV